MLVSKQSISDSFFCKFIDANWFSSPFFLSLLSFNSYLLQAKSNAPNANQRKKWRKSVIQLVPVPPPTARSENTEAPPQKADDNGASEADIPLKLPRAMRSAAPNTVSETDNGASEAEIPLRLPRAMRSASHGGIFLRDRNADQAEESINKETGVLPTRSPARPKRTSDEKENYGG
jgi:kinesin family protein 4/21/27